LQKQQITSLRANVISVAIYSLCHPEFSSGSKAS
jgi:hypothetical protein